MMTYFRVPLYDAEGNVKAYTLVDRQDLDYVLGFRWRSTNGYVSRAVRLGPGRQTSSRLPRVLLGLPRFDPRQVDHINRNPLDNRRANLRVVLPAINAQNKGSMAGSSSRFRGVSWSSQKRRWLAQAKLKGVQHNLGFYEDEEEAAAVASAWRSRNMPGAIEEAAA